MVWTGIGLLDHSVTHSVIRVNIISADVKMADSASPPRRRGIMTALAIFQGVATMTLIALIAVGMIWGPRVYLVARAILVSVIIAVGTLFALVLLVFGWMLKCRLRASSEVNQQFISKAYSSSRCQHCTDVHTDNAVDGHLCCWLDGQCSCCIAVPTSWFGCPQDDCASTCGWHGVRNHAHQCAEHAAASE